MTYKVYSAPRGTEMPSPIDKHNLLFKEFATLDQALAWARHVNDSGRVTLSIEGDDGTRLTKHDVVTTLHHRENDLVEQAS